MIVCALLDVVLGYCFLLALVTHNDCLKNDDDGWLGIFWYGEQRSIEVGDSRRNW